MDFAAEAEPGGGRRRALRRQWGTSYVAWMTDQCTLPVAHACVYVCVGRHLQIARCLPRGLGRTKSILLRTRTMRLLGSEVRIIRSTSQQRIVHACAQASAQAEA